MDDKELIDIYTDYLISSFGLTTGTDYHVYWMVRLVMIVFNDF